MLLLMKKRMQILMSLTLTAFLFLGLTSLSAQSSLSAGPSIIAESSTSRDLVSFQESVDAITTIQTELQTNYNLNNPVQPNTPANAATFYRMFYLRAVQSHLQQGSETGSAIFQGYYDVVNAAKATYPNLINETWRATMITLLSN
jgi:hypothetical protein